MNFKEIDFQKKAIDRIYESSVKLLSMDNDEGKYKKIIFQSPTGSGKTVMASKILEKIALESEHKVSFIWISKGILAEQSRKSFKAYIGGGGMQFSSLDEIVESEIKENEILFTNWEKIFSKANKDNSNKDVRKGDYTNKFMKHNEWDRNLTAFCENTRNAGRKIVLIIDESHLNITPNTLKIMLDIIQPHLRIDITATPKKDDYNYGNRDGEFITLDEVKLSKIIKKEVVINADLTKEELKKSEKDADIVVFDKAIEKRNQLLDAYNIEGSKIKPLILIQLPNNAEKVSVTDKSKIDWVEKYLDEEYGVNYENRKLAKWLSGDKSEDVETISDENSPVDFLIFKQAIATGWDCPRAQILIKFRQTGSETFEIQTVGRIMRAPEFKHYSNEILNRGYVYANLSKINIDETALEYLKTNIAHRTSDYENIDLYSIYLQRGEYNDLKYEYRKYFFEAFFNKIGGVCDISKASKNISKLKKYKSADGSTLNLDVENFSETIILDTVVLDIDNVDQIKAEDIAIAKISNDDINKHFTSFLKKNTGEYQQARSFDKIRVGIYQVFEKYLKLTGKDKYFIQKIVLANTGFFMNVIETSINSYSKYRRKTQKTIKANTAWNVPKEDFYPHNFKCIIQEKSIMTPSCYSDKWKTEVGFIENYLENSDQIKWWYKNGDAKNEIYFGIFFKDSTEEKTFYPDFIVQYNDGRIGIFDTKQGGTATSGDTKLKANALSRYIEEWNSKDKNLFGGIVVPTNNENTEFKLNQNKDDNYDYNENTWEELN